MKINKRLLLLVLNVAAGQPQVMAFSEVYQAMQTGVVDGPENSLPNFYTQKFFEVQKYLSLTAHGHDGYAVIVNKAFWDGLPANIRATLEKAMQEASDYENELSLKENQDDIAKIKASGRCEVIALTDAEQAALRKALVPLQRRASAPNGSRRCRRKPRRWATRIDRLTLTRVAMALREQ